VLTWALYAPIAVRVGVGSLVANPFVRPLSNALFLDNLPAFVTGLAEFWAPSAGLLVALLAGLVASVFAPGPQGREVRLLHASVLLSVPIIMVVQRVLPYERVFLAFLPLYYGLAAAGLYVVFERFTGSIGRAGQRAVAAAAFLAVLGTGIVGTIELHGRDRVFDDLPEVAVKLKAELRERDFILASIPLNEPLRLHVRRLGLDPRTVRDVYEIKAAAATGSDAGRRCDPQGEQRCNQAVAGGTEHSVRHRSKEGAIFGALPQLSFRGRKLLYLLRCQQCSLSYISARGGTFEPQLGG
jgi:hypothetical protein